MNRPETHEVFRRWRALARRYEPPRLLLGETYVFDAERSPGTTAPAPTSCTSPSTSASCTRPSRRRAARRVEQTEGAAAPGRLAGLDGLEPRRRPARDALVRRRRAEGRGCALLILLTLRGMPVLYKGDELAMENGAVPPDRVLDLAARRATRGGRRCLSRDGAEWRDPWPPSTPTRRNAQESERKTLGFTRRS